ncbi:unnamed protein product [Protopolystoma xenopodis]|uniref:Myb-like domain-containing protein n=1 Tax=Protopolystoma xenopodis TaxID=117903 RepID=A0A3S5BGG5_9PLAT|nr:unnamed protein product [Protopolystoma xenopodis]
MANATKVAEIFDHAALAFGKLAYLTLELKQAQAHTNETESKPSCKWSNREIELLKDSIIRFGNDLAKISEIIETKTTNQIKAKMRNKAFQTEKGRRKQRLGEVLDDQPFKRVRYQETTETPSGAVPARDRSQFSGPSTNAPTLDDPCGEL